jgi:mannose-6-phosphate isomerase-like protein (cupin superfamily)
MIAARFSLFEIEGRAMTSSYTHVKLTDVEDSAVKGGLSETQEARFANTALETEQTGLSHHRVRAGARQAFAHKHENAEEVYVVIAGSGRVKLDDEILQLEPLDALRVSPNVIRQFEGGDDGLEMIVFGQRHEGDGEIVPGWWAQD